MLNVEWETQNEEKKEKWKRKHERLLNEKTNSTEMERSTDKNSMIYNRCIWIYIWIYR